MMLYPSLNLRYLRDRTLHIDHYTGCPCISCIFAIIYCVQLNKIDYKTEFMLTYYCFKETLVSLHLMNSVYFVARKLSTALPVKVYVTHADCKYVTVTVRNRNVCLYSVHT